MGCAPRRPFRLSARAKDNARARLRGENPYAGADAGRSSSPTSAGADPVAKHAASFGGRSGKGGAADGRRVSVEGDTDGGGGDRGARRVRQSSRDGFGMNALKDQSHGVVRLESGSGAFREEGLGLGGDWEAAAEAAVTAAACGEGGDGGGRKSERKKLACGMCGAMRTPEDVSFRMTAKMVRETLFHVSFRVAGMRRAYLIGFRRGFENRQA